MFGSANFCDKTPSRFLKKNLKLLSFYSDIFKFFRNALRQFVSHRPQKHVISSAYTAQKMKFSIKNLFSKCDQIRSFLRILLHLLKNTFIWNFIFCAVLLNTYCCNGAMPTVSDMSVQNSIINEFSETRNFEEFLGILKDREDFPKIYKKKTLHGESYCRNLD